MRAKFTNKQATLTGAVFAAEGTTYCYEVVEACAVGDLRIAWEQDVYMSSECKLAEDIVAMCKDYEYRCFTPALAHRMHSDLSQLINLYDSRGELYTSRPWFKGAGARMFLGEPKGSFDLL